MFESLSLLLSNHQLEDVVTQHHVQSTGSGLGNLKQGSGNLLELLLTQMVNNGNTKTSAVGNNNNLDYVAPSSLLFGNHNTATTVGSKRKWMDPPCSPNGTATNSFLSDLINNRGVTTTATPVEPSATFLARPLNFFSLDSMKSSTPSCSSPSSTSSCPSSDDECCNGLSMQPIAKKIKGEQRPVMITRKDSSCSASTAASKDSSNRKKYCTYPDCDKLARGNCNGSPRCKRHGGGRRCQEPGCTKSARSGCGEVGARFCTKHGGGPRCNHLDLETGIKCTNGAEGGKKADGFYYCVKHGGGRKCQYICNGERCTKKDQSKGFCKAHYRVVFNQKLA